MNTYEVIYTKGYSTDEWRINVAAKDVARAIEDFKRYARKNYISVSDITGVKLVSVAKVYYPSPERKGKRK